MPPPPPTPPLLLLLTCLLLPLLPLLLLAPLQLRPLLPYLPLLAGPMWGVLAWQTLPPYLMLLLLLRPMLLPNAPPAARLPTRKQFAVRRLAAKRLAMLVGARSTVLVFLRKPEGGRKAASSWIAGRLRSSETKRPRRATHCERAAVGQRGHGGRGHVS